VKPLEQAFRDERAAVLATITRRLGGDLALAEDAVQDAFVTAAVEWDRRGVPDRPGAWLTTTAWRKALDRLRRDRVAAARAADLAHEPVSDDIDFDESALQDDQLRMVFTCCHPALPPEARMALTLRSVAGLTVPEIARAFLSSEEAMERRLTRARRKVTDAAIPFRVPPDELLPERLAGVLRVIYLVYTEGHTATRGEVPVRGDLCEEAIRFARLLAQLMPDEAETLGLLALLLLTDARRPSRVDAAGELVSLEHQDRSRWDARRITDGRATLGRALKLRRSGPYVIQAAIAARHAQATDFDSTDRPQIAAHSSWSLRGGFSDGRPRGTRHVTLPGLSPGPPRDPEPSTERERAASRRHGHFREGGIANLEAPLPSGESGSRVLTFAAIAAPRSADGKWPS
jgi:RNA polymerase sigma-70 factor (ECF subfamily)